MSGHLPSLDREALRKLRDAAAAMARQERTSLPMRELVEMARDAKTGVNGALGAGVTVDFEATQTLDQPLIVVRIPAPVEKPTSEVLASLTSREREVAKLVAEGLLNKQIASKLGVTIGTVKDHIHNVLHKTGLPNRAAVAVAAAHG